MATSPTSADEVYSQFVEGLDKLKEVNPTAYLALLEDLNSALKEMP